MAFDIDQLEDIGSQSFLFGYNRTRVLSFFDKDHGYRDGKPLRAFVEDALDQSGLPPPKRVMILCYPRMFGYVFNPLTVYYCWDQNERLFAIIYEVRNTFGGLQPYVIAVGEETSNCPHRHAADKKFYVSPFMEMAMRYHFQITPPKDDVSIKIVEKSGENTVFLATFDGNYVPFSSSNMLKTLFQFPLMTIKVFGAIHFEAFRLWKKGAKYVPQKSFSQEELRGGSPIAVRKTAGE